MLSRIGNNLFWMGRYIERTEHIARYTKVQYGSSIEAPLGQKQELVLESILEMAGSRQEYTQVQQQLIDNEVIRFITTSEENQFSLLGYIGMIRENARGARDNISTELWEAINSFYHKINGYASTDFPAEEIEFFAKKIEENSYVVKGYIENTLLRTEEYWLIALGIYLERAIQISLILQTKMADIEKTGSAKLGSALENYHWSNTLESTESFDMYMRCQKTSPNRHNVLHFLLFDRDCPKSVAFSLAQVRLCIQEITFQEEKKKESLDFVEGKLFSLFKDNTIADIEDTALKFLDTTLESLYDLGHQLNVKYLSYT